jgi:predicted ArsR family transcriptional regulator
MPTREASRDRVLAVLRQSAVPIGVAGLTAATGLSPNAVRFHLQRLLEMGAVGAATDPDRAGPGRPAVLYTALAAEATDAGAAYRLLAGLLADELSRSAPATASVDAGRDWARSLAPHMNAAGGQEPIVAMRDLFTLTGFNPKIRADRQTVELHRCPFFDLAAQRPDIVCGIHLGLVTELLADLGAPQKVRLVPVLDGSGPCLVRLSGSEPPIAVSSR